MPLGIILVAIAMGAAYILSPPPTATGASTGGTCGHEASWAGCGVPRRPTYRDWLDCQEWRAEKHARRDAEDRAP